MLTKKGFDFKQFLLKYVFEILVVVMAVVLCFTTKGFASFKNIIGILRSMAMIGVLAFGIMTVIICGEIDLSAVSTVAMTGVVIGKLCNAMPDNHVAAVLLGTLIMVGVAGAIGSLNSYLVLRFHFPAFIATMAVNFVTFGITATISNGFPVIGFPSWYNVIGGGTLFGVVPVPAIILIVIYVVTNFILNNTKMGRAVFAVGGNMQSARLSGVNVPKVKRFSFIYVQLMAVLSGIMVSSQVMSGSYSFANGWDFQAISCVIIGGTSFTGGAGRVWGTLVGLFFYGMVNNAMTLLNVSQFIQYIIRGLIILLAVIINSYRKD